MQLAIETCIWVWKNAKTDLGTRDISRAAANYGGRSRPPLSPPEKLMPPVLRRRLFDIMKV